MSTYSSYCIHPIHLSTHTKVLYRIRYTLLPKSISEIGENIGVRVCRRLYTYKRIAELNSLLNTQYTTSYSERMELSRQHKQPKTRNKKKTERKNFCLLVRLLSLSLSAAVADIVTVPRRSYNVLEQKSHSRHRLSNFSHSPNGMTGIVIIIICVCVCSLCCSEYFSMWR